MGLSLRNINVKSSRSFLLVVVVFSYAGAGVVRQRAVVGQRDVFLLPLLVQRAATPLPQDALSKTATGVTSLTANRPPNLPKFRAAPSKCPRKSSAAAESTRINRSPPRKAEKDETTDFCAAYVRGNK